MLRTSRLYGIQDTRYRVQDRTNNQSHTRSLSCILHLASCIGTIVIACAPAPQIMRHEEPSVLQSPRHEESSESVVPDVISTANAHYEEGQRAMDQGLWEQAQTELEQALALVWQSDFQSAAEGAAEERRLLRAEIEQALDDLDVRRSIPNVSDEDSLYTEEREVSAGFTWLLHSEPPDTTMTGTDAPLPDISRFDLSIVMNRPVNEAFHFLRTTGYASFSMWLNRTNRYLPMIRSIFQKEGLPHDLAFIALIESGFHPRAYTEDGTAGLWQFTLQTGRTHGLQRTTWIDERLDPEKSTWAAAGYFKSLYAMFGDWGLAIAAHHAGEESVRQAIETTGGSDFWQMDLPRETARFVPFVMAAATIAKNPGAYGFQLQSTPPLTYETVIVDQSLHLQTIAEGMQIPLDQLQSLNPELREWRIPPGGYALKIPVGSQPNFLAWAGIEPPVPDQSNLTIYTVRRGDTILGIARRFRVYADDIIAENEIRRPDRLRVGQALLIPSYGKKTVAAKSIRQTTTSPPASYNKTPNPDTHTQLTYRVKRGDTLGAVSRRYGVPLAAILYWNKLNDPRDLRSGQELTIWTPEGNKPERQIVDSTPDGQTLAYTVKRGDTLWDIARQFNVTVSSVRAANNLSRRTAIYPGDKLTIRMPAGRKPERQVADSTPDGQTLAYTVKRGDTLWDIARQFNVTVSSVRAANNLSRRTAIYPGDKLKIILPSSGQ